MTPFVDQWLRFLHNVAMLEEGIVQRLASTPKLANETDDQWIRRILQLLADQLNALATITQRCVKQLLRQYIPVATEATVRVGTFSSDEDFEEFTAKAKAKLKDGINSPSVWRNLVKTSVQKVSTDASLDVYEENKELIQGYQWLATLDSRTCPRCAVYDGQVWYFKPQRGQKAERSKPSQPLHPNCRCTYVPVLKSAQQIERKLNLRPGTLDKRVLTGEPTERLSYDEWLATQPEDVQKDALGDRFPLFKKGVPMDRFVSGGRILEPEEIEATTKIKKVPAAKVRKTSVAKVESGDVSPEVTTLAKKTSVRATIKKSRSAKIIGRFDYLKEDVKPLRFGKLRSREIVRRTKVEEKTFEERYEVFEYYDTNPGKLEEFASQFEDLPIPDITTRGVDLPWPSRHLVVSETREGFTESLSRGPSEGSIGVLIHPRIANEIMTDADKDALLKDAPSCWRHGAMRPSARRGTLVLFECPCTKKWEYV